MKKFTSFAVLVPIVLSLPHHSSADRNGPETSSTCVVNCPVVATDTSPVCASDGITYGSECVLRAVQCRNSSIVKLHDGKCDDNVSLVSTDQPPSVNDAFHTPCTNEPYVEPCKKMCNNADMKFCGSNNITYQNPCQFHNAQCDTPSLRFKHTGPCISLLSS